MKDRDIDNKNKERQIDGKTNRVTESIYCCSSSSSGATRKREKKVFIERC